MKKMLEWGVLGALFCIPFVPFIVAQSMFFPFITGKAFAFRFLVGIALALWGALLVYDRSFVPKKSPVLWAVLIFFGIVALADVFGVNFHRSLWSNFERMEGLVTFLYLCAFFVVSSTVLTRTKKWATFWNTSIIASCIMGIYAVLQVMGVLAISQGGLRVDATMGNSIYLAVYMLIHIFLTLWLWYEKRTSRGRSIFYGIALVLQLVTLFYTGTRGAIFGLIGGLGLAALLVAWRGGEHPRLRKISIGAILGILLLVGGFLAIRKTTFVQSSDTLQRFANISLSDGTVQSRLVLWSSIAKKGFFERPILGWGQDNFLNVFGKYYDPRMYRQEPWFDRAHNVFFDWLISAGALGLLSYLSLFGIALYVLWKKSAHLSVPERALGTGLLAGYFVHNIFVFDNLISYIFFLLFLGFIASTYARDEESIAVSPAQKNTFGATTSITDDVILRRILVVGAVVIVGVLTYVTTVPHIRASHDIIVMLTDAQAGDLSGARAAIDQALADSVGADEARLQLTRLTFSVAGATDPSVTQDIKQEFLTHTLDELQKSEQNDPGGTRAKYFLAVFYARVGNYAEAARLYGELLAINPDRQIFLSEYGLVLELSKQPERAEAVFKRLYDISPENDDAVSRYTASLFAHGKRSDAEKLLTTYFNGLLGDRPVTLSAFPQTDSFGSAYTIMNFELARFQMRREMVSAGDYALSIRDLANGGKKTEAIILADDMAYFYPESKGKAESLKAAIRAGQTIVIQDSATSSPVVQ
jgi:O-antigen ligase